MYDLTIVGEYLVITNTTDNKVVFDFPRGDIMPHVREYRRALTGAWIETLRGR